MTLYEIRITCRRDQSQVVVTATLLGNHAAVRRAHMLAGPEDLVEVWHGAKCVYANSPALAAAY